MSVLHPNVRGHTGTRTARCIARLENADNVRIEVEAEQYAADERTAHLKALRLARQKAVS
ncbi:hypothetical protein MKK67_05960 [Methylobacterium sp. J-072]|uniref:hypothetical protein n=1 Tax=Methylobacterium sp. J-072 TaxID=2836651 RepID=UPI001FBB5C2C|nr:hypothetical protein [Methylobacterium sp. J-072]MCJ2092050.1 hypothetical protein [Methylobacterium sp. J-072]